MTSVSVIGSGAWGTTLSQVLCDAGNDVLIWGRNHEVIAEIAKKRTNEKFIPGAQLPENLNATTEIEVALAAAEVIVLAVPAQTLRANLLNWKAFFPTDKPVISSLKGIEIQSNLRMSEVVRDCIAMSDSLVGIISGPNLASELILRQPAGAVGASTNPEISKLIAKLFKTNYFRVYTSDDLLGCELAGSAKSIIALAVGMVVGMGLGENTQATIITRGLNEVSKLGVALGANPLTFAGLAGMGDLVASCSSGLSRNRTFGEVLGGGNSMNEARLKVNKTVEGVATAGAVLEIAHSLGVEVPIIEAVADVVSNTLTPAEAVQRLMALNIGAEIDHV